MCLHKTLVLPMVEGMESDFSKIAFRLNVLEQSLLVQGMVLNLEKRLDNSVKGCRE
jgi:hypothetical protein